MPESKLTPTQQNLLTYLDKLAIAPYSPELMEEGYQALDAAVQEAQSLQESIHEASHAMRNAKASSELEGGTK